MGRGRAGAIAPGCHPHRALGRGRPTMSHPPGEAQARVDALLREQTQGLPAEEAVVLLATLANRAANELHKLARQEALARKGAEEWGNWAALQNASRNVILQASTCRELANRIVSRLR